MQYKLIIPGTLPSLNDYLKAERVTIRHQGSFTTKGNIMKQEWQGYIIHYIRQQLKGLHIEKQIDLHYLFMEPNRKRDKDNISGFAHKVIQDSLVESDTINNDGWKNIGDTYDKCDVDVENPRIEVVIVEVD